MLAISRTTGRLRDGAIICLVAVASLAATVANAVPPRDPAAGVGVVFAPWVGGDAALLRSVGAGARFVRYGLFPFIVVVVPDEAGYSQRISREGAWLTVDPRSILACAQSGKQ